MMENEMDQKMESEMEARAYSGINPLLLGINPRTP